MKEFAFVSDFDGTITKKDFYHIIIDDYLGEKGREFYNTWKKNKKINVEFLNKIFSQINLLEDDLKNLIKRLPIDVSAIKLMNEVRELGGDFYIVSAGTSYYIKILLDFLSIENVEVISMKGVYANGGLKIIPDNSSPFYSDVFGIDKGKVIKILKDNYKKIYFAGDSEPDFSAAKIADVVFGKGELEDILIRNARDYISYDDFSSILYYIKAVESQKLQVI